jgi:membrane protein implicated in regulation of membrane protease activity
LTGDRPRVYLPARMPWWLWMIAGMALLLAELVLPSDFFLFFFGLAAVLVGVLVGVGLGGPAWLPWLLFGVLAIAAVLGLRRPLRQRFARGVPPATGDRLLGEIARLASDLAPGEVGKAELRGSIWSVRTREPHRLEAGRRVRVERVEGLTLWVVPEEARRDG